MDNGKTRNGPNKNRTLISQTGAKNLIMDKILLNGISCTAHLGVLPEERKETQKVLIDLVLCLDIDTAAKLDKVQFSVDYQQIVNQVQKIVKDSRFNLLEALAAEVCQTVLKKNNLESVQVIVRKFPESLRNQLTDVAVEITRIKKHITQKNKS